MKENWLQILYYQLWIIHNVVSDAIYVHYEEGMKTIIKYFVCVLTRLP